MKKNQRGIAHVLAIVFILALIVLAISVVFNYILPRYTQSKMQYAPYIPPREVSMHKAETSANTSATKPNTDKKEVGIGFNPDAGDDIVKYQDLIAYSGNKVWYLKEGDIWQATKNGNSFETKVSVDYDLDIVDFDVSSNGKLALFGVKEFDYVSQIYSFDIDTVYIKNLETNNINQIYTVNPDAENGITDLKFTPDVKKIIIANNAIRIANINDFKFGEYEKKEKDAFCGNYFVNEFSENNDLVLIRLGCYEGAYQVVYNMNDNESIFELRNGYVGGGDWALDFTDNESLLIYNNEATIERDLVPEDVVFYTQNIYTNTRKEVWHAGEQNFYNRVLSDSSNIYFFHPETLTLYRYKEGSIEQVNEKAGWAITWEPGKREQRHLLMFGNIASPNIEGVTKVDQIQNYEPGWFLSTGALDF